MLAEAKEEELEALNAEVEQLRQRVQVRLRACLRGDGGVGGKGGWEGAGCWVSCGSAAVSSDVFCAQVTHVLVLCGCRSWRASWRRPWRSRRPCRPRTPRRYVTSCTTHRRGPRPRTRQMDPLGPQSLHCTCTTAMHDEATGRTMLARVCVQVASLNDSLRSTRAQVRKPGHSTPHGHTVTCLHAHAAYPLTRTPTHTHNHHVRTRRRTRRGRRRRQGSRQSRRAWTHTSRRCVRPQHRTAPRWDPTHIEPRSEPTPVCVCVCVCGVSG
jgi:hypothetical protein